MLTASGNRTLLGVLVLLFLTSCDVPIVGSLGNLLDVRSSVAEVLDTDQIHVSLTNGSHLQISATNSRFNLLALDERRSAADRAAAKAYITYAEPAKLSQISITFVSSKKKFVIVSYEEVVDSFKYSKKDLVEMLPNQALHSAVQLTRRPLQSR